jgi:mono/diheme cytochrome c family protein
MASEGDFVKGEDMKLLGLFAAVMTLGLLAGQSNQNTEIKKVPARYTRADSGAQMFKSYCAPCHGLDGKGDGPAAPALKAVPADLTALKQNSNGTFPSMKVSQILRGNDAVVAHGTSAMPLWGPIFHGLDAGDSEVRELRIHNLTQYVESIQN